MKKLHSAGKAIVALVVMTAGMLLAACSGSDKDTHVVKNLEDLHGARVGVQLGTSSDVAITEYEKSGDGTVVERFTKTGDAISALKQNKLDCVVTDEIPAQAYLRVNPSLKTLPKAFEESDYAICISKKNGKLLAEINSAINVLKQQGVMDKIMEAHIINHKDIAYTPKKDIDRSRGKIVWATNATFEPFEYHKNGKIVGIDIDIANAICDYLGYECEIMDIEFDAIITSVQTGKSDAGIAGITETPERRKSIDFTQNYCKVRQVVIVNDDLASASDEPTFSERIHNCFVEDARYTYILKGLGNTFVITIFALIISLILGTLIAIVRSTHDRNGNLKVLNAVCHVYLTVMRGTPTMVQLLIIYYVVFASANVSQIFVAVIAFGLNSAAYIAEVIRSGIMSVDKGQLEAGRSLGLSYAKTMRLVILPQAFKNVLPAMGNEGITLLKETSISGYIGLVDLTKGSDIIRSVTYEAVLPLGLVAVIYMIVVLTLSQGVSRLEKRLQK